MEHERQACCLLHADLQQQGEVHFTLWNDHQWEGGAALFWRFFDTRKSGSHFTTMILSLLLMWMINVPMISEPRTENITSMEKQSTIIFPTFSTVGGATNSGPGGHRGPNSGNTILMDCDPPCHLCQTVVFLNQLKHMETNILNEKVERDVFTWIHSIGA